MRGGRWTPVSLTPPYVLLTGTRSCGRAMWNYATCWPTAPRSSKLTSRSWRRERWVVFLFPLGHTHYFEMACYWDVAQCDFNSATFGNSFPAVMKGYFWSTWALCRNKRSKAMNWKKNPKTIIVTITPAVCTDSNAAYLQLAAGSQCYCLKVALVLFHKRHDCQNTQRKHYHPGLFIFVTASISCNTRNIQISAYFGHIFFCKLTKPNPLL